MQNKSKGQPGGISGTYFLRTALKYIIYISGRHNICVRLFSRMTMRMNHDLVFPSSDSSHRYVSYTETIIFQRMLELLELR